MAKTLAVISLLIILSAPAFSRSRTPIHEFLAGTADNKGMGIENPSLVELMSNAHGTLVSIHNRIEDAKKDIADPKVKPRAKALWEARLRRARVQYRLAWEMLGLFVDRSLSNTPLGPQEDNAGFGLRPLKAKHPEWFSSSDDPQELARRDRLIKGYLLDRAGTIYLNMLKFLSLKHEPIVIPEKRVRQAERAGVDLEAGEVSAALAKYAWLDDPAVALSEKDALKNFIFEKLSNPELKVELYENEALMPKAREIVDGMKRILNKPLPTNIDLNKPTAEQKDALAKYVLGQRAAFTDPKHRTQASGLVHLYVHVLGALIDPFNVNTHDSLELARSAVTVGFRHILDIDGNESLSLVQARNWEPMAGLKVADADGKMSSFLPLKSILSRFHTRLWEIYWQEVQTGPHLQDKDRDTESKRNEFLQYHGSILLDLFGKDLRHWIWSREAARKDPHYQTDPDSDPRLGAAVKVKRNGVEVPEGRDSAGEARPEMAELQDGDLWMEKGTGMGSDLISFATAPAAPAAQTKTFIEKSSMWKLATAKSYYIWAGALGWVEKKLQVADMKGAADWVGNHDKPGKGIDYTGTSHTGIVEVFEDPSYPQLARADLVDSFPNLPRQAWRRHGCGHSHSRLCMFLRARGSWARQFANSMDAKSLIDAPAYRQLQNEISNLGTKVRAPYNYVVGDQAESSCHDLLTRVFNFKSEKEMMDDRERQRPAYRYCLKVFQRRGMRNFYTQIIGRGAHRPLSGENTEAADARLVKEMGKLVTAVGRNIRTQQGFEKGIGAEFDDRFDSFSKGALYCSEFADIAYRLAWGQEVYPESQFKGLIRKVEDIVPENMVGKVTGGFLKVPWADEDTVYAPKGVLEVAEGRAIWDVIGEMRRAFFGVTDE